MALKECPECNSDYIKITNRINNVYGIYKQYECINCGFVWDTILENGFLYTIGDDIK